MSEDNVVKEVIGLKWRFVDPAKPEVALTRGTNNNIASIWDFTIWTKEGYHRHEQDFGLYPKKGDPLEVTLALEDSYPLEQVGRVSISFVDDIDIRDLDNLSDKFVGTYYQW
ncbi:MAG: hypothetical protein LBO82_00630, partial [Synergistaceae bacterium]|nr:hypothetical protein [Synergistaceae bacterium]